MPETGITSFRKQFLALARKRLRPGSGSSLLFLDQRTWTFPVINLNAILPKKSFVIVGGVATRLYMPERFTLDLDILISNESSDLIYACLTKAGAEEIGILSVGERQWKFSDNTLLDVLEFDDPWVTDALQNPQFSPDGLPVIALPYLVLMKMQANRAQDLADISRMLGAADDKDLEAVRKAIQCHLPGDSEDLESLILLGKMERQ
jgi:hypothetical protein